MKIRMRDPDGSYIFGETVDEDHLRVERSNISARGEILYKPSYLDWSDVYTRGRRGCWLSPHALIEYSSTAQEFDLGDGD